MCVQEAKSTFVLSKKASLTQKEISPENSPEKTHQPETKKKINHSKEKNSKDNKIKQEPYHPESSSDKDKNKSSSFSFTGKAQNMLKKIDQFFWVFKKNMQKLCWIY